MSKQLWPIPTIPKLRAPIRAHCHLCEFPLDLETCKVDEEGKPVHEVCYLHSIEFKSSAS